MQCYRRFLMDAASATAAPPERAAAVENDLTASTCARLGDLLPRAFRSLLRADRKSIQRRRSPDRGTKRSSHPRTRIGNLLVIYSRYSA
jgi:hypothetical protein